MFPGVDRGSKYPAMKRTEDEFIARSQCHQHDTTSALRRETGLQLLATILSETGGTKNEGDGVVWEKGDEGPFWNVTFLT